MSAKSRIRFALQIVLVCLYSTPSHYHHYAKFSEDIELIKMPVRYVLSSVWVRLSIFSQLSIIQSIIQHVGLCVFCLPTPLVMIERIYILMSHLCLIIITKSEVWTITHCLGLGHETIVCAACLSIFLLAHHRGPVMGTTGDMRAPPSIIDLDNRLWHSGSNKPATQNGPTTLQLINPCGTLWFILNQLSVSYLPATDVEWITRSS